MLYSMRPDEIEKIKEVNGTYDDRTVKCLCGIHNEKPSHCQQGPLPETRMPGCGFTFDNGERKGACLQCCKCCVLPRHKGSPYGFYDPNGSKCVHLVMEDSE